MDLFRCSCLCGWTWAAVLSCNDTRDSDSRESLSILLSTPLSCSLCDCCWLKVVLPPFARSPAPPLLPLLLTAEEKAVFRTVVVLVGGFLVLGGCATTTLPLTLPLRARIPVPTLPSGPSSTRPLSLYVWPKLLCFITKEEPGGAGRPEGSAEVLFFFFSAGGLYCK